MDISKEKLTNYYIIKDKIIGNFERGHTQVSLLFCLSAHHIHVFISKEKNDLANMLILWFYFTNYLDNSLNLK